MYEEDIKAINKWFEEHTDYGTYHADGEYSIRSSDIGEFTDFFKENITDCVGIECMVGSNGIWFWESSLERAEMY